MPFRMGLPELLIILVVVLLIFGPNRIAKIAGELGRGIRSFKDGVNPDEDDEEGSEDQPEES